jgi:hypothetical protein
MGCDGVLCLCMVDWRCSRLITNEGRREADSGSGACCLADVICRQQRCNAARQLQPRLGDQAPAAACHAVSSAAASPTCIDAQAWLGAVCMCGAVQSLAVM